MENTYNARIKFSFLGFVDNSLFWQLGFSTEVGDFATNKRIVNSPESIAHILSTLELHQWEDLPRKFARIKVVDGVVVKIGNLINNSWVVLE